MAIEISFLLTSNEIDQHSLIMMKAVHWKGDKSDKREESKSEMLSEETFIGHLWGDLTVKLNSKWSILD